MILHVLYEVVVDEIFTFIAHNCRIKFRWFVKYRHEHFHILGLSKNRSELGESRRP